MRRTKIEITSSEMYWNEAKDFVRRNSSDQKNPSWFVIDRTMDKHIDAWEDYFKWRIGFVTAGLTYLTSFKIDTFLVPCEWPEWFDSRFTKKPSFDAVVIQGGKE